jgi:tripartite-type tricarboxylate transporter receptor subunit TctC
VKARFSDLGAMMLVSSPADFGRFVDEEMHKWATMVKLAGIKAI